MPKTLTQIQTAENDTRAKAWHYEAALASVASAESTIASTGRVIAEIDGQRKLLDAVEQTAAKIGADVEIIGRSDRFGAPMLLQGPVRNVILTHVRAAVALLDQRLDDAKARLASARAALVKAKTTVQQFEDE